MNAYRLQKTLIADFLGEPNLEISSWGFFLLLEFESNNK